MPLNYSTYVSQIANLMPINSSDANFVIMLPGAIDYAEQRMYRELDLLATRVTDTTASFTAQSRTFTFPTTQGTFLVVEEINAITPAGATPAAGTRSPLSAVSKQFLDAVYPSATVGTSVTQVPAFFAPLNNTQVLIGPPADDSYIAEVIGTQRPTPLSTTNSSTILTQMLPDAFIAASMVFVSGYMRDFGGQSDNPAQAQSWEAQYKTLIGSANVEELRKKYQSNAWTSEQPSPIATPARV